MTSWTAIAKLAQGPKGPESRRHPRFRANTMVIEQGEILDFSATGLRIRFKKAPRYQIGQFADLTLLSPKGEHRCRAEVMWVKPCGRKAAEIGFKFPDEATVHQMQLFRCAWDPLADGEWSNR